MNSNCDALTQQAGRDARKGWENQLRSGYVAKMSGIYSIFEGTSEIQRLVVARAISGIHIA
jgi:alkylation response protein AidB-like acyl-CoA dehydrogenase